MSRKRPPSPGAALAPIPRPKSPAPASAYALPEEVHDLPWEDDVECGPADEDLEEFEMRELEPV